MQSLGARVIVTEIDPINALQAAMEGYEVTTMEEAAAQGDIFVTATGCRDIIRGEHMQADEERRDRLQHRPLRSRDRHGLARTASKDVKKVEHQAAGRPATRSPTASSILVLAEGRLVNLGCATGHPSFVMSN